MTMTLYKIGRYEPTIEPVKVLRMTERFVVFPDKWAQSNRHFKEKKNGNYFGSFDEAKGALVANLETELKHCRDAVEECRERLAIARELKA